MLEKKKLKKELRILGMDDSPFSKFRDKKCRVVATIFRGGNYMDALLSCFIEVDGFDSTEKIISLVKKSRHIEQLQCIMTKGIALAGFNIIDIQELSKKTKLPVIVMMRKMPNFKRIENALKKANKKTASKKLELIKKAGKIFCLKLKDKKIYFQTAGISEKKASDIIKLSSSHSLIPEPLRISHIIASGIAFGESRGRA